MKVNNDDIVHFVTNGSEILDDENETLPSEGAKGSSAPAWRLALDYSQMVLTISGFVANSLTVLFLVKSNNSFSKVTRILLIHQSLVDSFACACALVLLVSEPYGLVGVYGLDTVICLLWHGQFIFWYVVFISIYNLVLIAYERYLAIRHPLKIGNFGQRDIFRFVAAIYILGIFCNIGAAFQTNISENGTCVNEYLFDSELTEFLYTGFAVLIGISYWFIPVVLFAVMYGFIGYTLHKRKNNQQLGTSRVIDKASRQLTLTSIAITFIFIVTIGFDIWYYLLGKLKVVIYENNSPLQKVSVWLSAFNSVVNPYVYIIMMPNFRRSVVEIFCARRHRNRNHMRGSASNDTAVSHVSSERI